MPLARAGSDKYFSLDEWGGNLVTDNMKQLEVLCSWAKLSPKPHTFQHHLGSRKQPRTERL